MFAFEQPAELLTAEQLAATLGVSAKTIRRYVAAGRLPAPIRIGKLQRWRRADVESALSR